MRVHPRKDPDLPNQNKVIGEASATTIMERADSVLSLAHSELSECFPILFEICGRVIVDLVLLQKGVHSHSRFNPQGAAGAERL